MPMVETDYRCPACGADVEMDEEWGTFHCVEHGNEYDLDDLDELHEELAAGRPVEFAGHYHEEA